jgi:hypothetical protein
VGDFRTVYALFTSLEPTMAALRVASELATRLGASVRLIHFRSVEPRRRRPDEPASSDVDAEFVANRFKSAGVAASLSVYVCRDPRQAMPMAFGRRSLIVVGDRRRLWPTRAERLYRALQDAGHYVLFVDEDRHAA